MAIRAKRGTAKGKIGIFVYLDPELHRRFLDAVAERDVHKSPLVEAAIRQELDHPTFKPQQEAFHDVA